MDSFQQGRAYTLLNNSSSNEDYDRGDVRSSNTQEMLEISSPVSQNSFMNDLAPEPTIVENFVPLYNPVCSLLCSPAQGLETPFVIGGGSLRSEEPVSGHEYGSIVDRLVADGTDSPRSQLFLSKVHPSDNLDEKRSSDLKAKSSITKDVVQSHGDDPKQATDGLRFLIVVRNFPFVFFVYLFILPALT